MLNKLIKIKKTYTNSNGETRETWQFYLDINGSLVRIMPYSFKDSEGKVSNSTYKTLLLIAEER